MEPKVFLYSEASLSVLSTLQHSSLLIVPCDSLTFKRPTETYWGDLNLEIAFHIGTTSIRIYSFGSNTSAEPELLCINDRSGGRACFNHADSDERR